MIDELLTSYKALLESETLPGGLIEGVKSVKLGDDLPLADYDLPGIALDVVDLPFDRGSSGSAPGSRFEWTIPVRIVLYDTDSHRVFARRKVWKLLTPTSPNSPGGLRWLISKYNKVTLDSGHIMYATPGSFSVGSITKSNFRLTGAVSTITFTTFGPVPS